MIALALLAACSGPSAMGGAGGSGGAVAGGRGGSGGSVTGGRGGSGTGGTAGTAATGGSGGASGTGGTSGAGGTAGTGGVSGSGGASGTGGTSGSSGSGGTSGSSGSGGTSGTGGTAGTGGSPTTDAGPRDALAVETGVRTMPAPPATWMEHWFEHNQLVKLVDYDDHVAIYFDDDVPRMQSTWILSFMSRMWQYAKQQYGDMGPDRLFSIHHQGRYSGGHPSYYFDGSHDMRNVSDVGPGPWNPGAYDIASHEVAHVVESTAAGAQGSPSFPVWRDSKWAEIFQYDVYLALGLTADAQRVFTRFTNQSDSFPRAGTRWFRDWYYPLYRDRGGVKLLSRYFQLLAQHFPKNGKRYSRNMNFGEYVHFMCGAAQMDCKAMAEAAFGNAWEAQYQAARTAFPQITY